jgi:type IV fimbrial biogenesis protein FimT
MTDDIPQAIQCGSLTEVGSQVALAPNESPAALCFSGDGRQTTLTNPTAIGVNCTAGAARYSVAPTTQHAENRRLQLDVSLSGAVRMCDPDKARTAPDGCR